MGPEHRRSQAHVRSAATVGPEHWDLGRPISGLGTGYHFAVLRHAHWHRHGGNGTPNGWQGGEMGEAVEKNPPDSGKPVCYGICNEV